MSLIKSKQSEKWDAKFTRAGQNFKTGLDDLKFHIVIQRKDTLDYEKITVNEFSFEWSHFRISSTELNVRTIFYSIINRTKGKYCSVAFI